MEQLLFHGKKTVPAALRRDMWTPFFSIHFPPTIHGSEAGKLAYQRLRELSLQRQLSPPKDMVSVTQKDIDEMKAKYDPITLRDRLEYRDLILPKIGHRLPQKALAKRLMDQKATSVADACFVLGLSLESQTPTELRKARLQKFKGRMAQMGRRAKTRLQKIRQLEARKRDLIRLLACQAQSTHHKDGHLTLTKHAAARISNEYLGYSRLWGGLEKLTKIEAAKDAKVTEAELRESMADLQAQIDALLGGKPLPQTDTSKADMVEGDPTDTNGAKMVGSSEENNGKAPEVVETPVEQVLMVKMMWADQRDSTYALQEWPEAVMHGSLERWAESKEVIGRKIVRNKALDENGESVAGSPEILPVLKSSRSIHVIGGEQDSLWARHPEEASVVRQGKEAAYEKRQDAAVLMNRKMEQAVQFLREELYENLREETSKTSVGQLREELRRDETRLAATEQDRHYQRVALEQQWWALNPEEREGIDRDRVILLARTLKLRELRQAATGDVDAGTRESVARRDAAKVRGEDGVEIDAPKSGWFDRVKALVWRR